MRSAWSGRETARAARIAWPQLSAGCSAGRQSGPVGVGFPGDGPSHGVFPCFLNSSFRATHEAALKPHMRRAITPVRLSTFVPSG